MAAGSWDRCRGLVKEAIERVLCQLSHSPLTVFTAFDSSFFENQACDSREFSAGQNLGKLRISLTPKGVQTVAAEFVKEYPFGL